MRFADGEDLLISAGDAYYIRPGHNAHINEDAEFVEFTQADQTPGINTVAIFHPPRLLRPGGMASASQWAELTHPGDISWLRRRRRRR